MLFSFLKKLLVFGSIGSNIWSAPGVQLHNQIQEKLQQLSSTENDQDRQRIQREILELQQQINQVADERQGVYQNDGRAQSPLNGINNRNLNRDTYFYRGPVPNPSAFTPFLSQSWQRGYGTNKLVMEGAPVPVLNHPNAYINEVPDPFGPPKRNPYTNPWETSFNGASYQRPGSQYLHPNPNMYPGSQLNQYQPRFGFNRPFHNPYPGMGFHRPFSNFYAGYRGNYSPGSQVKQNAQATEIASFDAVQRYQAELHNNPHQVGAGRISTNVKQSTRLDNGQIQITVTSSGGVTGQGIGQDRYYLYSNTGAFLRQLDQPMTGGSDARQTTVKRYTVSNQQKFQIDRWLAERGYNQFGDPLGTMYPGGNPLQTINDGNGHHDTTALRFNYILNNHPQLVNLFNIANP